MADLDLPISPARFAAALKDLPISTLHLKAAELRNSIAHLDYSNEELRPFAAANDEDCIEAIAENEVVIQRMQDRIGLLKAEVENRGLVWREFMGPGDLAKDEQEERLVNGTSSAVTNGEGSAQEAERHSAWTDGTFQTGRIAQGEVVMDGVQVTNGHTGGRLSDEELRRRMEERMRADAEEEDGMHL